MADGQPEMIPMPDNPPQGESAPELTRQLSPDEERNVLLNFMGNMYGEANKMDSNIIGEATTLKRGASQEIKKQIERVYTQPPQPVPQQVQAAPSPQPEVKQPPVEKIPVTKVESDVILNNDPQLSFNFDITEKDELFLLIEKMLSRLNDLHKKVDNLTELVQNSKITSLPIKKRVKKTS
tara:strand:- start:58 stop:597 length:540 start_codon:yes stop_codon:yes gene_type:complete